MLVNLLTNARMRWRARGGRGRPQATSRSRRRGSRRGAIGDRGRDRGTGISAEDLPRIFDPYFTTRRTGTGLGLAISRNIVEGLRGTIAIGSRTRRRHDGAGRAPHQLMPARGSILLVDDETKILNALAAARPRRRPRRRRGRPTRARRSACCRSGCSTCWSSTT